MDTDELIRGLAADLHPRASLEKGLLLALACGIAGAVLLFLLMLAPRAGLLGLLSDPRLQLKFVVSLSLAAAALPLAIQLSRPGANARAAALALLLPAGALAIGVGLEMARSPEASWMPGLIGHNAAYCLAFIPLLSAPVLAAVLLALRRGAPTRPGRAGAAAGALAGGCGAGLYALHCTDDSPLFVMAWYGLAIGALALAGAWIGRRLLAW